MSDLPFEGTHDPRFDVVRDTFLRVLEEQPGTGASLAVWHGGSWVVDLWGGWADAAHTRPWTRDTLVMPYSVTKPFAAVCALLLADRGLDLDAPLTTYWPELTARTTMREVLAHWSGLVVLDEDAPEEVFYDWDRMCALLARQPPAWEPGTAHGESALFYATSSARSYGAPTAARSGGSRTRSAAPLDFQVGVAEQDLGRVADLTGFDEEFRRAGVEGRSDLYVRALNNPPGALDPAVLNGTAAHRRGAGGERARHRPRGGRPVRRARAGPAAHRGPAGTGDRARRDRADLVLGGERSWGSGSRSTPTATGWAGSAGASGGGARPAATRSRSSPATSATTTGATGSRTRRATSRRCRRCDPAAAGVIARPYPRQASCRVHPCGNRGPGDEPPTRMSELP